MPLELGGGIIQGKVIFTSGDGFSWAVAVPYGEDGALIYVHKADVALLEKAAV